jgi:hypothetical protein
MGSKDEKCFGERPRWFQSSGQSSEESRHELLTPKPQDMRRPAIWLMTSQCERRPRAQRWRCLACKA